MPEIILSSIAPNASVTKWYREQMQSMMDEMRAEIIRDIVKPYKAEIAMDGILDWIGHVMDSLIERWGDRLDRMSDEIAAELVKKSKTHYDKRLLNQLKKRGFTANFRPTRFMEDQAQIALQENVALIKSIGNEYLDKVRSAVWRSVKNGYDQQSLVSQLKQIDGVTDRRAKNIAKDQTAKLNQAFEDARADELGITKAKWMHSSAVKEPRREHKAVNGQVYNIKEGIQFSNGWFKPAEDFGCKCRKYLIIEIPDLG